MQTLSSIPTYVDRIYAVDDASTDNTFQIISEQAENDSRIVVIKRRKNGGVGASVVCGYKMALFEKIEIAVVMAGDGQMDPVYLPGLLDPIIEGEAEFTKGNRLFRRDLRCGMTSWRYFGNVVLSYMNMIASGYWRVVDPQNGYIAITWKALNAINLDSIYPRYAFENDMLVKLNVHDIRVVNVPIPARYGEEESKITYGSFIIRTSGYFLRAFFWRLWKKYMASNGPDGISSEARQSESGNHIASPYDDGVCELIPNTPSQETLESNSRGTSYAMLETSKLVGGNPK